MAAVHNGHINILRKLIKLGYTDKKAITSITIYEQRIVFQKIQQNDLQIRRLARIKNQ